MPSRFHIAQANFEIKLRHILKKIPLGKIEKARCVAQSLVFRELTREETFCATESEVERSFELQRKQPAREQNLSYKPQRKMLVIKIDSLEEKQIQTKEKLQRKQPVREQNLSYKPQGKM